VRREGRQVALDALLVAEIGEDGREARQPRAFGGGNEHAALRHQRAETQRLEPHRLAAGVRSGDDQRAAVDGHEQVDRRHGAAGEQQARMANRVERDGAVGKRRPGAAIGTGEAGPGDQAIEVDQRLDAAPDRRVLGAHQAGQVGQDALHDQLLLAHGEQQGVVELDREQRLDEQGLAGDRAVLHDALHLRRRAGPHRNDEAVVAQRDVGVGHDVGHAAARHQIFELAGQALAQLAYRAAHARQGVAGLIEHHPVIVERALQRRLQVRKGDQSLADLAQRVGGVAVAAEKRADGADGLQRPAHRDQHLAVEREAFMGGAAQVRPHVGEGAERRITVLLEQPKALPGALQRRIGRAALGDWGQPAAALLAGGRGCELRQPRADARKFERDEIAGTHGGYYIEAFCRVQRRGSRSAFSVQRRERCATDARASCSRRQFPKLKRRSAPATPNVRR
jgi:hypothetical protein